jgi:hypothetical protein
MKPEYLFRKGPDQPFYCTHREGAFYRYVCGHCAYPVTTTNTECPRCRRPLETCPVCTEHTHRRPALAGKRTDPQAERCTVCSVRRLPTGAPVQLADIDGSFCRNLHGCPAGGLLLFKTEQFAVLDSKARSCPVCRHTTLQPLSLKAFSRACEQCLFCHELFAIDSVAILGHHRDHETRPRGEPAKESCLVCGRRDVLTSKDDQDSVTFQLYDDNEMSLPWRDYLHLVDLARTLLTERQDEQASASLFSRWTARPLSASSVTLESLCEALLAGTLEPNHRQALQPRITFLLADWERRWGTTAVNLGAPPSPVSPS